MTQVTKPSVIIGLGNPDAKYQQTRHNAGFMVIDKLGELFGGHWQSSSDKQIAEVSIHGHRVLLIKPMQYMNNSGVVVPFIKMKGIQSQDCLVIHDELEKPLGSHSIKIGGSARGHNGLRSLIEAWGTADFARLRFGIGRPERKEEVAAYVLQRFEDISLVDKQAQEAVALLEKLYITAE